MMEFDIVTNREPIWLGAVHILSKDCGYSWILTTINLGKWNNISLTRILRPFGDDFPNPNHDFQGSGEQGSVVMKCTHHSWMLGYSWILTAIHGCYWCYLSHFSMWTPRVSPIGCQKPWRLRCSPQSTPPAVQWCRHWSRHRPNTQRLHLSSPFVDEKYHQKTTINKYICMCFCIYIYILCIKICVSLGTLWHETQNWQVCRFRKFIQNALCGVQFSRA